MPGGHTMPTPTFSSLPTEEADEHVLDDCEHNLDKHGVARRVKAAKTYVFSRKSNNINTFPDDNAAEGDSSEDEY